MQESYIKSKLNLRTLHAVQTKIKDLKIPCPNELSFSKIYAYNDSDDHTKTPCFISAEPVHRPKYIYAIGDLHADLDVLIAILVKTGLVDGKLDWAGGDNALIQCGDMIDGRRVNIKHSIKDKEAEVTLVKYFAGLGIQAQKKNGICINLIGNHDLGRINPIEKHHFKSNYATKGTSDADRFMIYLAGCFSKYIFKISNLLFVHGGICPKYLRKITMITNTKNYRQLMNFLNATAESYAHGVIQFNTVLSEMSSDDSFCWYRVLDDLNEVNHEKIKRNVQDKVFQTFGIKKNGYLMVSHTPINDIYRYPHITPVFPQTKDYEYLNQYKQLESSKGHNIFLDVMMSQAFNDDRWSERNYKTKLPRALKFGLCSDGTYRPIEEIVVHRDECENIWKNIERKFKNKFP